MKNAGLNPKPIFIFSALCGLIISGLYAPSAKASSWTTNSPMTAARQNQTATLLPSGKVLVAGGWNGGSALASAEVFDPATGSWLGIGSMTTNRYYHTATMLPNGKVLVAGGKDSRGDTLATTELFDPFTGTWTNTGAMNTSRYFHTATLLASGQVMVVGGYNGNVLASVEIYDPATGVWSVTNSLNVGRGNHTATLLQNGQVLVAGGWNGNISEIGNPSAEIFDPNTGAWTVTNSMNTARQNHTATLLPNGQVLLAGGAAATGSTNSAELFNPANGNWTTIVSMITKRETHAATLLPNGEVLLTGGSAGSSLTNSEIYDPVGGSWSPAPSFNTPRASHVAVLLVSGKVLVAGGYAKTAATNSSETYDYATATWTDTGSMNEALDVHSATPLPDGTVLVAGSPDTPSTAEIYYPSTGTWTNTPNMNYTHYWGGHSANLLPDGTVLVEGGELSDWTATPGAELYVPASSAWVITGSLNTARYLHTSTLMPNGKVLVAGGYNWNGSAVYLSSAEIYDPVGKLWKVTSPMTTTRWQHSATLLTNGLVLVAGGTHNGVAVGTAELYNPASGTWTITGNLKTGRWAHTATLLPSGQVLIAGGDDGAQLNGGTTLTTAELYNPITGSWTLTGSMNSPHANHAAMLLPNGKVLVAGGFVQGTGASSSCEVYDPATGKWTTIGNMDTKRSNFSATLLTTGDVLVTGGSNGSGPIANAALCHIGLGYSLSWQPQLSEVSSPVALSGSVLISGAQFRGVAEGSSGNSQDSSADYPLVQLRSMENGQTFFVAPKVWATNSFASALLSGFPPGYALTTVFVNGVPSTSSILDISVPIPTPMVLSNPKLVNGSFNFSFTNTPGALFGVLMATNLTEPLTNWTSLSGVTEYSPGTFQFSDTGATNSSQRYYLLYAP